TPKVLEQMTQGLPGVEDVVEKEDIPAPAIEGQVGFNMKATGVNGRAAITRSLNQADSQGQIEPAHQVRKEDEASGQDANHRQRPAGIVAGDLFSQFIDSLLNALGRQQHLHGLLTPAWKD